MSTFGFICFISINLIKNVVKTAINTLIFHHAESLFSTEAKNVITSISSTTEKSQPRVSRRGMKEPLSLRMLSTQSFTNKTNT